MSCVTGNLGRDACPRLAVEFSWEACQADLGRDVPVADVLPSQMELREGPISVGTVPEI